MEYQLQELVADYRVKSKSWHELLEVESLKRESMLVTDGAEESEPDNLRERLDDYAVDSGLREKQQKALFDLKEAERKLFSWHLEHVQSPHELEELKQLARDYAGRITWLRRFLEDGEDAKS